MSNLTRKNETDAERADREELEGVLSQEINNAEGGSSDELQANRTEAMQYYHGVEARTNLPDRSHAVSHDVADMINATLAMIVPMLSTDAVVAFEPIGDDDEEQAKAESDACNELIIEENNGYMEIQEAIKDALLLKNGCMKVSMRDIETIETLDIAGIEDDEFAMLILNLEPNQIATRDGEELRVVTVKRRFLVNAVPIENISYQSGYTGRFQNLRFFAERIRYTRSQLVTMGIDEDLVELIPADTDQPNSTELARSPELNDNPQAYTSDQQNIDCYECYLRIDLDGDGVSERYKVLTAGNDIVLTWEAADMIPYALGSPFLNPHKITGESLFDHLKSTQDTKTALKRQLLDNVSTINNGRYVYDPDSTYEEDILNPIAGGGIRARNPERSVFPLAVPDVQAGIMVSIAYEDKVRSERGGASLDLMGAEPQLVGETAHGIERQYGSREAMASMIARNLSESMLKSLYLIVHEYLRRWANEPFVTRVNGQFTETNPSEWPQRKRVNITTGMTAGERGHLQQTLMMHMQLQSQAMQTGLTGILATPETLYRTSQSWLRLAGVDNPERLAVDPMSEGAMLVKEQQQQQQAQQQELAAQQQQTIQTLMMQLEQAKLAEDARQHDEDTRFKYYDADLSAEVKVGEVSGKGAIELEKQRMSDRSARENTQSDNRTDIVEEVIN